MFSTGYNGSDCLTAAQDSVMMALELRSVTIFLLLGSNYPDSESAIKNGTKKERIVQYSSGTR